MPNKHKGTVEIELGGDTYTLRPSFEALIEFEDKVGKSVSEVFEAMQESKASFKIIATAVWAGMMGEAIAQNNPKLEKPWAWVGEMIRKEGLQKHFISAYTFVAYSVLPESAMDEIDNKSSEDLEAEGKKQG